MNIAAGRNSETGEETMPQLRSLPAEPVMRDLYRAYPATCKPLGEFTEAAMRGPSRLSAN